MNIPCLVNGELTHQINVFDRGLFYGDGLFETIAMRERRLPLWHRHMQRLMEGCKRLGMEAPDASLLESEVSKLVDQNTNNGIIRITLTRGIGQRGYRPQPKSSPTRIISLHNDKVASTDHRQIGIALRRCQTRLGISCVAGLKHLNRLEQVVAQSEWSAEEGFQEGLMLDYDDNVIEGTMSNIFVVRGNEMLTPKLDKCGVAGVMRASIIDIAKDNNIPIQITTLSLSDLKNASEVFMTNRTIRIWPVGQFEELNWTMPGKLTSELMSLLDEELSTSGIRF